MNPEPVNRAAPCHDAGGQGSNRRPSRGSGAETQTVSQRRWRGLGSNGNLFPGLAPVGVISEKTFHKHSKVSGFMVTAFSRLDSDQACLSALFELAKRITWAPAFLLL